ncbi:MAG: hypothetical protein ACLQGP_05925 [Isosphaeraceae bacterium]
MIQLMSRRSALKLAMGVSFPAALFVSGCSEKSEVDPTIKVEAGKTAEESIQGRFREGKPKADPSPTQRVKGGPG